MLFQQFVGVNAVIHYLPTLFKGLGLKQDMELAMSGVSYGIQLLGVISNLWTIDKVGRKRLLVYGSSLMLICLVVTAGLTSQFSSDWSSCRDAGWICVGFLFIYMLAFGASWGPIAWAVPSEVFPNFLRAK
jgi:MFS family permease